MNPLLLKARISFKINRGASEASHLDKSRVSYENITRKIRKPQKTQNEYNIILSMLHHYPCLNDIFKNLLFDNRNLKLQVNL
jgi:hypothetical protein